jgi:hypothetical protein
MRKLTRMEANKEVRRVLTRHSVDLSYSQYSVAGKDVRLTGWLCKIDTSDFNAVQVENLVQEFQRKLPGYSISGDMDNWSFTSDHISYIGDRMKGRDEEDQLQDLVIDPDSEAS